MRHFYLLAAIIMAIIVMLNLPRLAWIPVEADSPMGLMRGLQHGVIGFSYQATWLLIAAGVYQIILGIVYWDMDTTEAERWQFALQSGGTARLMWAGGAITLLLGILYAFYVYRNDSMAGSAGLASTAGALVTCWLGWMAFPLMEQVGIDREELGV